MAVSADRTVTALMTQPEGESSGWLFVYAPGAGSNVHDPFGAHACHRLAAEGFSSVRFQFPYMEDGRRRPDRTSVLEATWRRIIDAVRAPGLRLVIGGRSMGGRIARTSWRRAWKSMRLPFSPIRCARPGGPSSFVTAI